jgi:hypothetical protein
VSSQWPPERGDDAGGDAARGDGDGAEGVPAGDDPFAHLTLDESFVASARISEPTAAARERAARAANLQRLLADEAAQRANEADLRRRLAPGDAWEDEWGDLAERRRDRPVLKVVALVVVVAMVAVYVLSQFLSRTESPVRALDPSATSVSMPPRAAPDEPTVQLVRPADWPPPSPETSPTPLGEPAPVPDGGGPHEFIMLQPDGVTPVAYDPCRPIHFVTRPGGPPEGDVLIREAVAEVSAATGLRFVDDGTTDEGPSDDRAPYQPGRYGDRWAPVLFTWSDPAESPRLGEVSPEDPMADPAAYAGSIAVGLDDGSGVEGDRVFVTGSVTLDARDLGRTLEGPDGRARVRAVIAHEVAHLVGLGHVDDRSQLMYPTIQAGVTSFQPGDLEGLAALGRGRCFPDI